MEFKKLTTEEAQARYVNSNVVRRKVLTSDMKYSNIAIMTDSDVDG